jgi:tetratricopeptide (TPR) repeat protein
MARSHSQSRTLDPSPLSQPSLADMLCNDGLVLHERGRYAEAVASFDLALTMRSDDVAALNNRGVALNALGRHADALASYDRALKLQPDYVSALYNRARSLDELQRYDEALACYDQVLALDPHHVVAHNNRGVALDVLDRSEEALASFAKALALRPDYVEALSNRGTALIDLDRLDDAMASYDAAIALDPNSVEDRWNKSLLQLRMGSLAAGWEGHEWRRKRDTWEPRHFLGPEWDGTTQPGRRVLLYAEQALGDAIQFARFARTVATAGNEVILEVQRPLVTLMQTLPGVTVVGKGAPLPAFDCHLPLMSVPHTMRLPGVSADGPYLAAEADRTRRWRRLLSGEDLRVGIAWRGNPKAPGPSRAIPLEAFLPLSRIAGVRLISLQKDDGAGELGELPNGMTVETLGADFDAGADAFLDTAAVMMNLDLVVTSDTSIAHLAGALGRPVWIAMRHVTDWRWMVRGETTPWYSTARVFKQTVRGDWDGVFARIAFELARFAGRTRSRGL